MIFETRLWTLQSDEEDGAPSKKDPKQDPNLA